MSTSTLSVPLFTRLNRDRAHSSAGVVDGVSHLQPTQLKERSHSALSIRIPERSTSVSPYPYTPTGDRPQTPLSTHEVKQLEVVALTETPRLSPMRSNSTSSLYIKETLQHPDSVAIIYTISRRIFSQVDQNSKMSQQEWDLAVSKVPTVFDEYRYRPPSSKKFDVETLFQFINHVFKMAQMPDACDVPIFALIYLDRIVAKGIPLLTWNWRPLVFSALVVASKVWDDESMWNRSFAKIYPMFALKDINRMEAEFLGQLDYCMTIQAEEYTKYYFTLQDERTDHKSSSSREQLNRETAEKLEVMSHKAEVNTQKRKPLRRGDSMRMGKKTGSSAAIVD